ncbi:Predicted metalloprotease [Modestobacter sp. DSM 44400]|uniref:neutral zinc metallopeptidase n=1 Tax=Modestobacter sp. DSM 44400 TaxID=1550230 RepID=UPI0008970E0B|nr:neutral zinc metallopeptidase [Modestobacter sp. DSM 44400]SDX66214.1 Predicted metalloprotease [Modestobacter sp. DSM 44400]
MPSPSRRLLAAVVVVSIAALPVLAGCGVTFVVGSASPATGQVGTVQSQDFPVIGATEDEIDQLARNALVDLNVFWQNQFPDTFGQEFTPLRGGYYSVDPANIDPTQYPGGQIGCGETPDAVEDNAFYCPPSNEYPNGDAIQYDRAFLQDLANEYGRFLPALVMAHEFGHAIQGRVGYPLQASIAIETQADCFAGAWTAWVADGNAPHTTIRTPELDDVLRGYLLLRDPVGTDLNESEAHGSLFDRVSAFQQGFDDGPTACRDEFGADRIYTQREFDPADAATQGNASYPVTQQLVTESLSTFWSRTFTARGETFAAPDVVPFSGTAPDCAGQGNEQADLVFCANKDTVGYDETDLVRPVYEELGDYAVLTAVAIPYSLAARDQLGLSTDDQDAARSAVCLTGAFTRSVLSGEVNGITISPGDADESVQFLLGYSDDPDVLGDVGLSGFQLVDVFRSGVVEGESSCGIG